MSHQKDGESMPTSIGATVSAQMARIAAFVAGASERLRLKTKSVRGLPIAEWPCEWSANEVFSVALVSKVPLQRIVRHVWALYPGLFRRNTRA